MKSVLEIEEWLNKYSISNYIITDELYVTVFGNVNLNGKLKEKKLPVKMEDIQTQLADMSKAIIGLNEKLDRKPEPEKESFIKRLFR